MPAVRVFAAAVVALIRPACAATQDALVLLQKQSSATSARYNGASAPLTEAGYQAVASLRNDTEMKGFILRAMNDSGLEVKSGKEADLEGLASWYSGSLATQNFLSLQRELRQKDWVTRAAGRGDASDELIAAAMDGVKDMATRLADKFTEVMSTLQWSGEIQASGNTSAKLADAPVPATVAVKNTSGLRVQPAALVEAKSGKKKVRKPVAVAAEAEAERKQKEVEEAAAHLKEAKEQARRVALTRDGYESVLAAKDKVLAREYMLRLPASEGMRILDTEAFESMLKYYDGECGTGTYGEFVAELHGAVEHVEACSSRWVELVPNRQGHATLIERWAGMADRVPTWRWQHYAKELANQTFAPAETPDSPFILTLNASEASLVKDAGTQNTFGHMIGYVAKIIGNAASLGGTAALDAEGYTAVANALDGAEMITFVRRVAAKEGLRVKDQATLKALLPFYDGECDTQTYETLVRELRKGARRPIACGGPWLEDA